MTPPDSGLGPDFQPTERTKVKRLHQRALYDRESVYEILDAGLMCHVGYVIYGQPYVTPTAYWREDDRIYWHGSSASRMLRGLKTGIPCCFTVSILDGLVLARSGFHSSINYRSVMALGHAEPLEDEDAKLASLKAFTDRLAPGRWDDQRPPTKQELKATTVLEMKLDEVSAKVRNGPAADDEEDYDMDIWAGEVPVRTVLGALIDDPRLKDGIMPPGYLDRISINALGEQ